MKKFMWMTLLSLPLVAMAADKSPDQSFYNNAAQGGMAEVQLGQMAEDKGQSAAVKDYGKMMVQDHTAANNKLKGIAAGKGVELPDTLSVSQMATRTKLKTLSGDSFDNSFIKSMVRDHKDAIKLFQKEAQSGQDPEAKAFAKSTLPTLQAHLKEIQSLATTAGVSPD